MDTTDIRDRVKNPSINWPESADEAFRAVFDATVAFLNGEAGAYWPLREYTTTTGPDRVMRTPRTLEQAQWLNIAVLEMQVRLHNGLGTRP